MLRSPSVVVKPHILVPKGAAQRGSLCCCGTCNVSCGCDVNYNPQPWEECPSKATTAAWRYFLHPDYLGGMQAVSLCLSRQPCCCLWLAIMHCLKLGKRWPPEANSCRPCNMFRHLLNQIIRGFLWKHLSTLHKLSRNHFPFGKGEQTQKHVTKGGLGDS